MSQQFYIGEICVDLDNFEQLHIQCHDQLNFSVLMETKLPKGCAEGINSSPKKLSC